jgi:uncharacterized iron-regulated membrane protein
MLYCNYSLQGLVSKSYFRKPQEAFNLLVTQKCYWALFYMRLYMIFYTICWMYKYRLKMKLDLKIYIEVKVTLRLTASQYVLVLGTPFGPHYQIVLFPFFCLKIALFFVLGHLLWWEDGSVICSAICQWSESRRNHNHTLLTHLRLPGSLSVASYDYGITVEVFLPASTRGRKKIYIIYLRIFT